MLKIRGMDIYYIRGDDDSFTIQPTQAYVDQAIKGALAAATVTYDGKITYKG